MKIFGKVNPDEYTVQEMYLSAPISWEIRSGSQGIYITTPSDLDDAIVIEQATNDPEDFFQYDYQPKINKSGTYEYLLYRSIKHLYYSENTYSTFYSGSTLVTSSISGLSDNSYVVSIGQIFYGDKIQPGSFEISSDDTANVIYDDQYGNLYTVDSGTNYYIGNIFYNTGIAVIFHDTASITTSISQNGLKIVSGSTLYIDYNSDVKITRHEAYVNLDPMDFNFSPFNPSIFSTFQTTASITQSLYDQNIKPTVGTSDTWNLYNLMSSRIIKPYVTTVGLYNDEYELLAVAKVSTPIQRTFDTNQIFIVRFDT